jgi:hypothetical protein
VLDRFSEIARKRRSEEEKEVQTGDRAYSVDYRGMEKRSKCR